MLCFALMSRVPITREQELHISQGSLRVTA
jgi:hypothetical protein